MPFACSAAWVSALTLECGFTKRQSSTYGRCAENPGLSLTVSHGVDLLQPSGDDEHKLSSWVSVIEMPLYLLQEGLLKIGAMSTVLQSIMASHCLGHVYLIMVGPHWKENHYILHYPYGVMSQKLIIDQNIGTR